MFVSTQLDAMVRFLNDADRTWGVVSRGDFIIHPGTGYEFLQLVFPTYRGSQPDSADLVIPWMMAAENYPSKYGETHIKVAELKSVWESKN